MKTIKLIATALFAGFILQQPVMSQTSAGEGQSPTAPPGAAGGASDVAAGAASQPAAAPTNAVAPGADTSTSTPAANKDIVAAADVAAASTSQTNSSASTVAEASTNTPPAGADVEMPITFQDVPITTAIETLARLANINYLMDPKINYGHSDAAGKTNAMPILSIHWENVTARQALSAVLDNYGLQLVQNPQTHIAKISMKEPNAKPPLITRVIQLKYASTSNMLNAVQSLLNDPDHRSKVVGDARTSQLVVIATEQEQSEVDALVAKLDMPTRQVEIETKLVEISSNPSTTKGIDWSGTLQAQNFAFGNGILAGTSTRTEPGTPVTTPAVTSPSGAVISPATTVTPGSSTVNTLVSSIGSGGFAASTAGGLLPNAGFLTADGVKAVLSFLNQSKEAQVMSTPKLVTLDNETATISVTRSFPIINVAAGTQNTAGGSSITYSNIGTTLEVTPRITANDYIWLKVMPEVSSFFGKDTQTISTGSGGTGGSSGLQTISADIFDTRRINTQVLIPNAHTLVMGGLVQDNPVAQFTKVPLLGDIPVLGLAFRSENKSLQKDNLLIFITPTIVRDTDFTPTTTDFLQSSPQTMKDPLNPNSWWDSAQRQGDWSNPLKTPENQTKPTVMP